MWRKGGREEEVDYYRPSPTDQTRRYWPVVVGRRGGGAGLVGPSLFGCVHEMGSPVLGTML
jgi:hypothetical protein